MKRLLSLFGLVVVLALGTVTVRADSVPVIEGDFTGIELCAQDLCGQAIFFGIYTGRVGPNHHALGTIAVAVNHEPLPDVGDSAAITGGVWRLRLLSGRTITGVVTGGELTNPFGNDTFGVSADLAIVSGGIGTLAFEGVLSHQTFPPTIIGELLQ
jgi:hypothetical protein